MSESGEILAVCLSEQTGEPKEPVEEAELVKEHGLRGDAHAGTGRQVSLLCEDSAVKLQSAGIDIRPGILAENLLVRGLSWRQMPIGARLRVVTDGEEALLEVTQIGKECHSACAIREAVGDCVMPREGIFARVLRGGPVRPGSKLEVTDAD